MQYTIVNLEGEIWKDIPGYEGRYMVSNLGRVYSSPKPGYKGGIRKLYIKNTGYAEVALSDGKNTKQMLVHRLVAKTFIPNTENKPQVNHINAVRDDNNLSNLEWCTPAENIRHCIKIGNKVVESGVLNHLSVGVVQKTLQGVVVNMFGSIREADRMTGINQSSIVKSCKGKVSHAGMYKWEYVFNK